MSDDPESALLQGLLKMAEPHADLCAFDIVRDGARLHVVYAGGSSARFEFSAPYAPTAAPVMVPSSAPGYRDAAGSTLAAVRPMRIELRRESDADRHFVATGLNREVQTGDPAFDRAVYVDSPTEPRVLAALLAPPEVRRAILTLLEYDFGRVTIDDEREQISAALATFPSPAAHPDAAARIVDAFATLVRALPAVARRPGAPDGGIPWRRRTATLATLAGLLFFAEIPLLFVVTPQRCIVDAGDGTSIASNAACMTPLAIALGGALVLAVLASLGLMAGAYRRVAGRSNSAPRLRRLGCATFVFVLEAAFVLLAALAYRLR